MIMENKENHGLIVLVILIAFIAALLIYINIK